MGTNHVAGFLQSAMISKRADAATCCRNRKLELAAAIPWCKEEEAALHSSRKLPGRGRISPLLALLTEKMANQGQRLKDCPARARDSRRGSLCGCRRVKEKLAVSNRSESCLKYGKL